MFKHILFSLTALVAGIAGAATAHAQFLSPQEAQALNFFQQGQVAAPAPLAAPAPTRLTGIQPATGPVRLAAPQIVSSPVPFGVTSIPPGAVPIPATGIAPFPFGPGGPVPGQANHPPQAIRAHQNGLSRTGAGTIAGGVTLLSAAVWTIVQSGRKKAYKSL